MASFIHIYTVVLIIQTHRDIGSRKAEWLDDSIKLLKMSLAIPNMSEKIQKIELEDNSLKKRGKMTQTKLHGQARNTKNLLKFEKNPPKFKKLQRAPYAHAVGRQMFRTNRVYFYHHDPMYT